MKTQKIYKNLLLITFCLSMFCMIKPENALASHFRYGHLTWKKIGANTAQFTLVDAFRRSGYGAPVVGSIITENVGATSLIFGDATSTPTLQYKVIAIDPAEDWLIAQALQPGSTTKTTIDHVYSGPTDPSGAPWVAEINTSARTGIEQNNPNGSYRILTYVELTSGNTSPSSALPAIVLLPQSPAATFLVPGADPDPSSAITFRLATSAEASGFGPFVQPAGLTVNSSTGLVTWNTMATVLGGLYSCQIILEDRDATTGAFRTQVGVDFLIEIVSCNPANATPAFIAPTPACGSTIVVLEGQLVSFVVAASDADVADLVSLNTGGLPSGATATPGLPVAGNPVSTTFDWTPGLGTAGVYPVIFTATDGCGAQTLCSFIIQVINCTAPTINCPGNQTATVNNAGCTAIVNYPAATVTGFPAPTVTYSQNSGTAFGLGTTTVTATATNPCGTVSCTFTVTVTSSLSVNAGADEQTFFGYIADQSVTHTAVGSGGTPPYTYSWSLNRPLKCNQLNSAGDESFSGGSCINNVCPSTGSPLFPPSCSGSASVTALLMDSGDICVTITDANGCTATDCFHVTAEDARCFAGNSGNVKVTICHHTNSASNPWVQICIAQSAVPAHLANNDGDYIGKCSSARYGNHGTAASQFLMTVYPNPANNKVNIEFESSVPDAYQLSVFDITGRTVLNSEGMTSEGENSIIVPISGMALGIYNLRLTVGDQSSMVRLVITR